jgi:hypothetical protein
MLLSHCGMMLLGLGACPALSRGLLADATIGSRHLAARLVVVVLAVAASMLLLGAVWPDYGHQLLTREWGIVEPLQFVNYLIAAILCFAVAQRSPQGTARLRLYRLGGGLAIVFALEEIDYVGLLSRMVRLAGVEGGRIGRSYFGGFHDLFNVAAEHGVTWVALLVLAVGMPAALYWISAGRIAAVREILSRRVVPGLVGVAFMTVAQSKDVHGLDFVGWFESRQLNDFLEEPLELLAILCLNVTFALELADRQRHMASAELDRTMTPPEITCARSA